MSGVSTRQALAVAVASATILGVMSAFSTQRRVGDGGEYVVMAAQLAAFESPTLTRAELDEWKARFRSLGGGFESALLDYPALVGRDGRQAFLHFWLYPLLAVPGVWIAQFLSVHPNWGFTFTNIALLAGSVFVVARVAPPIGVVFVFAGPIIWWIDKAHTEAFLFAALAIAAALIERWPAMAYVSLALAGAQNAAIGVVYPIGIGVALATSWRTGRLRRADVVAAIAGGAIVALPLAYNWVRLGKLAPMVEYAHVTVPSAAALLGFVAEPNIGLIASAPVYVLALVGLAIGLPRGSSSWDWRWPAIMQLALLLVWSQNPNANHGGTPGVNRWVLSLVPLSLPWFIGGYRSAPAALQQTLVALTLAFSAYSVYWHLPSQPERYLFPTRLAQSLWQRGWLGLTSAEVFAERTAHTEIPVMPLADEGCDVVLTWDMQWPVSCVPPEVDFPAACVGVESFCLAAQPDGSVYVRPASYNGFFFKPGLVSWPAAGPLASSIRHVLLSLDPTARRWRVASSRRWVGTQASIDAPVVLEREGRLFIYIARTGDAPLLRLDVGPDTVATVHTLIHLHALSPVLGSGSTLALPLPASASNLAVTLTSPVFRGDQP